MADIERAPVTGMAICGDALEVTRQMEDESIHMIVTSPPY